MLALTVVTLLDVLGRDLLNKPLTGATELTELLLVGMTFLFYPRLAWRGAHIAVDLFDWFRGPILRWVQRIVCGLLGALSFGGIAWQMGLLALRAASYGDVTPSLKLNLSWAMWFMAAMSAITAIAFVLAVFAAPKEVPPAPEPL
ncbi:MAG: TRAP transporter small permease [Burkholderiaceae bacterium]|nr:TRAP transporter small permease [Burkholderiaceae bacterium]